MARLTSSPSAFEAKLARNPGVQNAVRRVADEIRGEAEKYAFHRIPSISIAANIHVITGPGTGFTVRSVRGPRMPEATPRWSHDGTGIYGPKRRPIRPKNGQFLRFYWPKIDKVVYARQVRGRRPTYYMTDAATVVASRYRGVRVRRP